MLHDFPFFNLQSDYSLVAWFRLTCLLLAALGELCVVLLELSEVSLAGLDRLLQRLELLGLGLAHVALLLACTHITRKMSVLSSGGDWLGRGATDRARAC